MVLSCLLYALSLEEWAMLLTQRETAEAQDGSKGRSSTRSSYYSSVTIARAQAIGKRTAEFQRGFMAERMDSGSRETPRNGGVRDNKRKGRKARLSKDRMLWANRRRETVGSGKSHRKTLTLVGAACCYWLLSGAAAEGQGFQKLPRAGARGN